MMDNTVRALFERLCSRKAHWDEMKRHTWAGLTDAQRDALRSLPRTAIPLRALACDPLPPVVAGTPLDAQPCLRLILRGTETYYVNTEGYDYARYGFRIDGVVGEFPVAPVEA